MHDVIVVGGGVIGLSIARQLAGSRSVLLLDRGSTAVASSWAAAGMLSPLSEAEDQGPFFQLSWKSLGSYSQYVADLYNETGIDSGYSGGGLLCLAASEESFAVLRRRAEWQRKSGFDVALLSADDVHKLEPLVTMSVHGALLLPGETSVLPRPFVKALREACLRRGVETQTDLTIDSISKNTVRAGQVTLEAESIIIASGAWSGEIKGLDPAIPVHPRKGQILSLHMPTGAFRRMIRWQHSYFVPRTTGELVVGATEEDAGFDRSITAGGIGKLLADAQAISSHVGSYPILETWAGLRPGTPDGLPILGASAIPGVFYATGHYRNGVLLAPITAVIIKDLLESRKPCIDLSPYSPFRFL